MSFNTDTLKLRFTQLVKNQPHVNQFTERSRIAYDEWEESCRQIESQLREAGVDL